MFFGLNELQNCLVSTFGTNGFHFILVISFLSGGVYYMSESGRCIQCFSVDTPVKELLFYEEKNVLVTITENLMLTQHAVFGEGDTKEILKVNEIALLTV